MADAVRRKPNMAKEKVKMPEQDPNVRNRNFEEVALGYTPEMAMEEATRCLNCKKPFCMEGCPVNVPIPRFIEQVVAGNFEKAYEIITEENALPAITGRVCPQENQCEGKCVRGRAKGCESVGIGRLERFVADYHREHGEHKTPHVEKNGKKVAVVGSGPAGITCAGELARRGYDVHVFEALHKTGGVLSYGIPEFRLPKTIVQAEADVVADYGVDFETNVVVGRTITVDELEEAGWLELEDAGLELAGLLWDELGALLEEELSFINFVDTSLAKSSPDEVVFLPPAAEDALSVWLIITSSTLE